MGSALFYHLTRAPAESLVPILVDRALAQGWRVELRATDADRLARFDDLLWQREGFLPHGRAGGPHDARQPVLLTLPGQDPAGARACIVTIDGAEVTAPQCAHASRVCILFDGADPAAVDQARTRWKALTGARVAAEYWSDADGSWKKQASSPKPPAGT